MNYITREDTVVFSPEFNEKIDIKLLSIYKKVIFSNYELTDNLFDNYFHNDFDDCKWYSSLFNQKIDLPPNLTHLTFGWKFNQKVDLPTNLTHLTFGSYFNQKVDLPTNLTHLTFGFYFNQKIDLPPKLTHLTFGYWFNQKVDLPWNLKYLYLQMKETKIVDYLPDSLEELELGYYFDSSLDNLPISLQTLIISDKYDKNKLKNLPKNIKIIYHLKIDYQ